MDEGPRHRRRRRWRRIYDAVESWTPLAIVLFTSVLLVCTASYDIRVNQTFEPVSTARSSVDCGDVDGEDDGQQQSVLVALFVRNKAHSLTHFLAYLERLTYPKSRLYLFVRTDNNVDDSIALLTAWLASWSSVYAGVDFLHDGSGGNSSATLVTSPVARGGGGAGDVMNWTLSRQHRVALLYQTSLEKARRFWLDYVFIVEPDVMLTDEAVLTRLVQTERQQAVGAIGPLLDCPSRHDFVNFWLMRGRDGHNRDRLAALPARLTAVKQRRDRRIWRLGLVHSALLINVARLAGTRVHPPPDDFVAPADGRYFAALALACALEANGVSHHLDNRRVYGYFPSPVAASADLQFERDVFAHLKVQLQIARLRGLPPTKRVTLTWPLTDALATSSTLPAAPVGRPPDRLGLAEVYLINLRRRTERLAVMEYAMHTLGVDARLIEAVDGDALTPTLRDLLGLAALPGYRDPGSDRRMNNGEVGCLLSHFAVWQDVATRRYNRVLVLEDDVRFTVGFRGVVDAALTDADAHVPDWDLIYLGRKQLTPQAAELAVEGVPDARLIWPGYSYWTLAYILTRRGAQKLLDAEPLRRMLPVDEFLSVMFDQHPNPTWTASFATRNLVALSVNPLAVEPVYNLHEKEYISDTETSEVFCDE